MTGRGGIILALIVGLVAALLFADLAFKATDQFRSHVEAAASDDEAKARMGWGVGAKARLSFVNQSSVSVLSRVSGGSL